MATREAPIFPASSGGCNCCPTYITDCCPYEDCKGIEGCLKLTINGETFIIGQAGVWSSYVYVETMQEKRIVKFTLDCVGDHWELSALDTVSCVTLDSDTNYTNTCPTDDFSISFSLSLEFGDGYGTTAVTAVVSRGATPCDCCCCNWDTVSLGSPQFANDDCTDCEDFEVPEVVLEQDVDPCDGLRNTCLYSEENAFVPTCATPDIQSSNLWWQMHLTQGTTPGKCKIVLELTLVQVSGDPEIDPVNELLGRWEADDISTCDSVSYTLTLVASSDTCIMPMEIVATPAAPP